MLGTPWMCKEQFVETKLATFVCEDPDELQMYITIVTVRVFNSVLQWNFSTTNWQYPISL
jgi:hypothetical protein